MLIGLKMLRLPLFITLLTFVGFCPVVVKGDVRNSSAQKLENEHLLISFRSSSGDGVQSCFDVFDKHSKRWWKQVDAGMKMSGLRFSDNSVSFDLSLPHHPTGYRGVITLEVDKPEMTDHRILTHDRHVQQAAFANGVRVTVNFGAQDFTMSDGYILKAGNSRIEDAK
jgi:hypothetical protein